MAEQRIVERSQVLAARGLVEFASRGEGEVDEETRAIAAATRIPGTERYLVDAEPQSA